MSACASYQVDGDPTSGPCTHKAGYQTAGDEVADYCACHYGEPYPPTECPDSWPCTACGSGEHNTHQHGTGFNAEQHEWENHG